jgi:hypothetical protein
MQPVRVLRRSGLKDALRLFRLGRSPLTTFEAARRAPTARFLGRFGACGIFARLGLGGAAEEGRKLAHRAVLAAQTRGLVGGLLADQRRGGLRLDHGQRIAGTLCGLAFGAFPITALVTLAPAVPAVAAFTLLAGFGALFARPIITGTVVPIPLTLFARPVVTRTIIAIPGAIVALTVITLAVVTGTVVTVAAILEAIAVPAAFALLLAFTAVAALGGFGFRRFRRFLGLGLEVDVEAGGELLAADDVRQRTMRLEGPQGAEVVFRVLQVVLGQDAVARSRRVAGQLLVLLEDALSGAPHLHAFRAIRIEGPVGVLLLRLAAAAAAIAAALTLHTLEISHSNLRPALRRIR